METVRGRRLLFVRICGTGMSSLAISCRDMGAEVRGVDAAFYPPISDTLEREKIQTDTMDKLQEIVSEWKPEALIIGNALHGKSDEAAFVQSCGLPLFSMPSLIEEYLLPQKKSLVIAGTHGKTTTSTMLAEVLDVIGMNPSYIIGGVPLFSGVQSSYHSGSGYMVLEGDEYDTAFFDKEPKFLHYRPDVAIVTSIEFDHADIYDSLEQIFSKFVALTKITTKKVIVNIDFETNKKLVELIPPDKVLTYAVSSNAADFTVLNQESSGRYLSVTIGLPDGEKYAFETTLIGEQNVMNLLAVIALLWSENILQTHGKEIATAIRQMKGIKRRQELIGSLNGALIYSDFAHHPTAMRYTLEGFFDRFPDKKICAVFDPATNTNGQNVFEEEYKTLLAKCDAVMVGFPPKRERFAPEKQFHPEQVCDAINRASGVEKAWYLPDVDVMIDKLQTLLCDEWIVVVMSNSGFFGFFGKIENSDGYSIVQNK
ncbi:hypothetical protein KAH37_04095 [bacterium]|nr:hypothetical protein [bacterium]